MTALRPLSLALLLTGGAAAAWAAVQRPDAAPPQRVVSLNLCADQIILAVADRSQIAGLTRNAAKPEMSAAAAEAKGLRILSSSAEQVIVLDPDLVAGMPARRGAALAGIKDRNYPMLDLKTAESFVQIEDSIRRASAALGHAARGEALIARMRSDLARVPRSGEGRVAAYYQRRGFLTGTGTLIDEIMGRVGLVNLAAKLDKPSLSRVSLEEMVAARPNYLIVESATDRVTDQGTEMLHHPTLAGIPRVSIPQAWTVCGGPAYVKAVRSISDQVAAHEQAR